MHYEPQNFYLISLSQEKTDTLEHELRREVEDLKLRLQMAADHYKEKFKECQRLQKQINKLTDQAVSKIEFIQSEIFLLLIFLFANQILLYSKYQSLEYTLPLSTFQVIGLIM